MRCARARVCVYWHMLTCGHGGVEVREGDPRSELTLNGQIISPEGHARPPSIPSPTRSDQMELCLVQRS